MRIVVTNDDGLRSPGLRLLYEAVRELDEALVIAPMEQASAKGGMLTLDEPIRVYELDLTYASAYGITGSPRDVVHVAREVFGGLDMLVSGINIGENTSIQNILVSGTVGAAAEASLFDIPAVAFSADVNKPSALTERGYADFAVSVARAVARYVASEGLPSGVDLLNVNLPRSPTSLVRVVPPARRRWIEKLDRRVDPRGQCYYWLYGEATEPEPGTDSYVVFVERGIAISPISLSLKAVDISLLDALVTEVSSALKVKS
ncbi:MAG: 5'/3'-nucleotidase SurE [Thermofilaceae archaeon]|nr:5'/3'-nucleotidase SurE [Thermofilaceae archaeon]MCX8180501.1 5'/3'-nucleotidase SurE [Thermofilaceae archaeon]MDW8003302.1 5'/3'-nucleotidase SurE [Thermofilaceae archaeon]